MAAAWRERTVAVIGCGGLGVPAAWTLALAGARDLRVIDPDRVEASNLHRQVLYGEADVGRLKVEVIARRLGSDFPGLRIASVAERVDPENVESLLSGCSVVIEGSDDAFAKFVVNDWAVSNVAGQRQRHASIAAAIGRRGQWMVVHPGGGCYRCLFEEPPPAEMLATCLTAGVLGPVVATVGALAARSLIAVLEGRPDPADSALVRWLPGDIRTTSVAVASDCRCQRRR